MEELKRKAAQLWQDRKKRKGAIIACIVVVTVIASVTTITITSVNGSTSDDTGNNTATSSTPAEVQNGLPFNATSPEGQTNAASQSDLTRQMASNELASGGVKVDAPGAGINGITKDAAHNSASNVSEPSDSINNPQSTEPVAAVCTIAIDCSSISGNGILSAAGKPWLEPYAANPSILSPVEIKVNDANGDGRVGVDEAVKQACNTYGIQYEFKGGSYLKGMNYLYEFDAGKNSGWMYSVNGINPNKGCNSYYLNGGEDILWYYVTSY